MEFDLEKVEVGGWKYSGESCVEEVAGEATGEGPRRLLNRESATY
jgi:hypothetical protein